MTIGIICCKVLEKEIKQLVRDVPEVCHLEVMDWGLHTQPDLLKETLCRRIEVLQNEVQAIVLGYGRVRRWIKFREPIKSRFIILRQKIALEFYWTRNAMSKS